MVDLMYRSAVFEVGEGGENEGKYERREVELQKEK